MIRTWTHKGLGELFDTGTSAKVRPDQHRRCLRILDALNEAETPADMNIPGWNFHSLQGKPKRWAVAVNGPWRITFEFESGDAINVALEQYHRDSTVTKKSKAISERCPTHPGEVLREDVLPALNISVTDAARELGVTRQTLHRLMAGEIAVSPTMALRLGRWCGNGPGLWLRMQIAYDLWHAERALAASLAAIPSHMSA